MNRPRLLLFGPQTTIPPPKYLALIRSTLVDNQELEPLRSAIESLPQLLSLIRKELLSHNHRALLQHEATVEWFQKWIGEGANQSDSTSESMASNALASPLTIVIHLVQYYEYLKCLSPKHDHSWIVNIMKNTGIQGQCIGFLTAAALSLADDTTAAIANAAVAFRLAFCIGVLVDYGTNSTAAECFKCITVRSRKDSRTIESLLLYLNETNTPAYTSVIQDDSTVTLTAPASHVTHLLEVIRQRGYAAVLLSLSGRYHTDQNTPLAEALIRFCQHHKMLQFPTACGLNLPLRSNSQGMRINGTVIQETAIQSILVDVCNWSATLEQTFMDLAGEDDGPIMVFGLVECLFAASAKRNGREMLRYVDYMPDQSVSHNSSDAASERSSTTPSLPSEPFEKSRSYPSNAVAVIGMACRFAGADSTQELWDVIDQARSMAQEVKDDKFCTTGLRRDKDTRRSYWGNFINNLDQFDHKFFKMNSREAAAADPQQRLLLQTAYQALEDAGYFSHRRCDGQKAGQDDEVGCFVGCVAVDYENHVNQHPATAYSSIGTLRAFLSGRISHFFGWKGPSITYDTACSSSTVAIHAACQSLTLGDCSLAIAGGVNTTTIPSVYQNLQAASFLSSTGPTKAFDKSADGYCRGEGVGLIVLKKLQNAINDGDRILGVLTASALNQNTHSTSIVAPDAESQALLFKKAISRAGLTANDVSFVEAHGTGTQLGDKIESESIGSVFGNPQRDPMYVGSIKSNIGHTEATSGVASLIKVLLMMRRRIIPRQANLFTLNPNMPDLKSMNIKFPLQRQKWVSPYLAACINNYGAAGSNTVMVVEQPPNAPAAEQVRRTEMTRSLPIVVSAASETSLRNYLKALHEYLLRFTSSGEIRKLDAEDLAYNINLKKNTTLSWTFATVVSSLQEIMTQIAQEVQANGQQASPSRITQAPKVRKPVILVFGGQHGLSTTLDRRIFDSSSILRTNLTRCDQILHELGLEGIIPEIFNRDSPQSLVKYHCSLFAVQYSFAKTWIDSGLQVETLLGHSFGQLTALCIGGSLSQADAFKLIAGRASLIERHCQRDSGAMLAIEGSHDEVQRLILSINAPAQAQALEIACHNGPSSFVVAGQTMAIELLRKKINPLKTKLLETRCAFHSPVMDPILEDYKAIAEKIQWKESSMHVETCSDFASWTEPTADLIVEHTRGPVHFTQAVQRLSRRFGPCIWLEAGVGSPVIPMIRRANSESAVDSKNTYLAISDRDDIVKSVINATVNLRRENHSLYYWAHEFSDASQYLDLELPPYRFDGARHWLDYSDNYPAGVTQKPVEMNEQQAPYISFVRFCDKSAQISEFLVNRNHEKFKLLVDGHTVLGSPICPLTLFADLAFEASKHLASSGQESAEVKWMPKFSDIEVHVALGGLAISSISMFLFRDAVQELKWTFEVRSSSEKQSTEIGSATIRNVTGIISLHRQDETTESKDFTCLKRLFTADIEKRILGNGNEQSMQGPVLYNTFSRIIKYKDYYKGVRSVHSVGEESIGRIQAPVCKERDVLENTCHPLDIESFGQVAGVSINCFREDLEDDAFITNKLGTVHLAPSYLNRPQAIRSWLVYVKSTDASDRLIVSDIFVFDAETKQLSVVLLGVCFTRVSIASLTRVLRRANAIDKDNLDTQKSVLKDSPQPLPLPVIESPKLRQDSILFALLGDIFDLPSESITRETDLLDLGIDSLMSAEVLSGIHEKFGMEISVSQFMELTTVQDLCNILNFPSTSTDSSGQSTRPSSLFEFGTPQDGSSVSGKEESPGDLEVTTSDDEVALNPDDIQNALDVVQTKFEEVASQSGYLGYWRNVHPSQNRLALAYVAEAFAKLDCHLDSLQVGECVPEVQALSTHSKLISQLYEMLRGAGLIALTKSGYVRTALKLDSTPSYAIYSDLLERFPLWVNDLKLLHLTGPHLFECITGKYNGVDIIFASKESREVLSNCYKKSPICETVNTQLKMMLAQTLQKCSKEQEVKILEIGAGTGGTSLAVLEALTQYGINYSYDFTDKSLSLVNIAKKNFQSYRNVNFFILDVESAPPKSLRGKYHIIISANCVHATSDIVDSSIKIRHMLRDDGILALIEHTRNIPWFDLVFGLLDGWWAFNDDRKHAIADEIEWDSVLKKASFEHVDWTNHHSRESQAIRVIVAFAKKPKNPTTQLCASHLLIHPKSTVNRKTLFAIPGGFGTASTFTSLPKLHDALAMYALNSPFLACPHNLDVPFEILTSLYLAEIRRIQPYGPYSLIGYSVGGVVAYEAARQLINEDEIVQQLILIDSACPVTVPPLPLGISDILGELDPLSGTVRPNHKKTSTEKAFPHIAKSLTCLGNYMPKAIVNRKAPPTILLRAKQGVGSQHKVSRPEATTEENIALDWILNDRIEDPGVVTGWERLVGPENLSIIHVEGHHFNIMSEPQVSKLAQTLRLHLEI